jgi:hypothetical protein
MSCRHGCNDHDHSHDDDDHQLQSALEDTLFQQIDTIHLSCLNEHKKDAGKTVFKPWDQRLDTSLFVKSGVDTDLLFFIPFTVSVIPKSLCIVGDEDGGHPNICHVFKNKDNLDFSAVENMKPDQTFNLNVDTQAQLEYLFKQAKFNNTTSLTLYFPTNFGAKNTKIYYIGIKGTSTNYKRQIVHTVYESKPNPSDHKVKDDMGVGKSIE